MKKGITIGYKRVGGVIDVLKKPSDTLASQIAYVNTTFSAGKSTTYKQVQIIAYHKPMKTINLSEPAE